MISVEGGWLPEVDLSSGTLVVPVWLLGCCAALALLASLGYWVRRNGGADVAVGLRLLTLLTLIALGVLFLDRHLAQERAAERRAIEARETELAARAAAPGSALGCLDAAAGEAVDGPCEGALFASPDSVAAAVSYATARIGLFADEASRLWRPADQVGIARAAMSRAIASDRFGIYSHVLARRHGCSVDACKLFALLGDLSAIKANLAAARFDALVRHYAAAWPQASAAMPPSSGSLASASRSFNLAAPGVPNPQPLAPARSQPARTARSIDFPSASSIPPVSIMAPEPPEAAAPKPAGPKLRPARAGSAVPRGAEPSPASPQSPPTSEATGGSN